MAGSIDQSDQTTLGVKAISDLTETRVGKDYRIIINRVSNSCHDDNAARQWCGTRRHAGRPGRCPGSGWVASSNATDRITYAQLCWLVANRWTTPCQISGRAIRCTHMEIPTPPAPMEPQNQGRGALGQSITVLSQRSQMAWLIRPPAVPPWRACSAASIHSCWKPGMAAGGHATRPHQAQTVRMRGFGSDILLGRFSLVMAVRVIPTPQEDYSRVP
jgi:hypothetical protein